MPLNQYIYSSLEAGTWQSLNNAYRTAYAYDANGNIDTLKRHNELGVMIDHLTYDYDKHTTRYLAGGRAKLMRHIHDNFEKLTK